jgi:hypothetical protein
MKGDSIGNSPEGYLTVAKQKDNQHGQKYKF